ncbi:MAG TPA: hypothetical protein VGU45_03400 [Microvirga sp.]|jgi:hypothetical protein|nr:hypothetical protein [Microvirga sp.]
MRTIGRSLSLSGSALLLLLGPAAANDPVRATAGEVVLDPSAYEGRRVALGGCQLGQLADGPACWVLVKGRSVGVIRLQDLPGPLVEHVEENCPRAGIGNGSACLVRVFGRVETGSSLGPTLKNVEIKWPD